ncbi:hypothetical protein HNQ75_004199 [Rhizobium flavum]|jgi:hypothetical protein|uniref:Uncharacterized protein n=1 Tax=Pseudorhizobium flavum TaxID=1335061 RepID=A0A7X0DEV8_9HYPH|nr:MULTISPECIES: hypothetical protein [Hyphomicrobiales]MBB6182210.1 hypothetical protein [Pseudorhizobium flavum]
MIRFSGLLVLILSQWLSGKVESQGLIDMRLHQLGRFPELLPA